MTDFTKNQDAHNNAHSKVGAISTQLAKMKELIATLRATSTDKATVDQLSAALVIVTTAVTTISSDSLAAPVTPVAPVVK